MNPHHPAHLARAFLCASAIALSTGGALAKDETRTEAVELAPGATVTTLKGSLRGYSMVKYRLRGSAGQVLSVALTASNSQNYFNLLPPVADAALFVGSMANDQSWSGTLPHDGEYTVELYLMRAAARRNETSRYALKLSLTGPGQANRAADGPDFWDARDKAPLHSAPSATSRVVGELTANARGLRNLGCEAHAGARWCRIEAAGTQAWVEGRHLREGRGPAGDAKVKGTRFHATGEVRCRIAGAATACRFGVVRNGAGVANVHLTLPDGRQPVLAFAAGKVSLLGRDTPALEARREGDTWLVRLNAQDEVEIPEAVINGG